MITAYDNSVWCICCCNLHWNHLNDLELQCNMYLFRIRSTWRYRYSCFAVIVSEQFRHSMMIISIICYMTTSSTQFNNNTIWVSSGSTIHFQIQIQMYLRVRCFTYVRGVHPYLLALLWLVSRSLRENTTQNLSVSLFVCVCMRLCQSAHAHKEGKRTHT